MAKRKILWDKQAALYFLKSINYIQKDSPQNALVVKSTILSAIEKLPAHPEKHAPDKYKQNNMGNYRAFELYRLNCISR